MSALTGRALHKSIVRYKYRLLFIWLGLSYFIVYKYWPMYGLVISFQDYRLGNGFMDSSWVGFKHFQTFFGNPDFSQVLVNTLLISAYRLIWGFFPPVMLAILLSEMHKQWYKRLIQSLSYLPHFLSWVIIYGIALALFSEGSGLVNQLLKDAGQDTIPFLMSETWFRSVVVATDMWKDTGWGTIIYLAAIAGINPSLYEAAVVDGAGKWKQICHITVPGMIPVIFLLFILNTGKILDAGMEQIIVFYNPLVYSVGDIIDTWTYRMGILEGRYSLAAAVGFFKSFIGLILVVGANYAAKKYNDSGIW